MPSPKFHTKYHSKDVVVSSDGREVTRLPSATVPKPTQPAAAAAAASQTQPAAKSQRDLEETVKKFADAVSEKGRAMYEIWALVFNVLHLLQSIGAERVRWSPLGAVIPFSYTLGVTMILVLCHCGEHLGDEMMQGLVDYILHFKTVDVNEEDKTKANWTLLHHCAYKGNARLAKLLIERGACLNTQSSMGRFTPLHWAVYMNKINVVKVILSHDSDSVTLDTALLDWNGDTALDLAKLRGHDECVQLLTQHAADKAKKKKLNTRSN
ncbi:receptor-interacting serine/threonine-protein kinase 4-like isoform X2 [Sycon ciliatum]|uniref:receptor-interacting serine/threonine-protein kinase 4-like isoform X2 n=1 Tax=Sycon ciliatum TaxID=27933 RepID=UPI0031F63642